MYAYSREQNTQVRKILVEKTDNLESLNFYPLENYDTVEILCDNKIIDTGFLYGYAYRGGGTKIPKKNWKNRWIERSDIDELHCNTIGYINVRIFKNSKDGTGNLDVKGIYEYDKFNNLQHVHILPCKMVLIEKAVMAHYEYAEEFARIEWQKNPIFGG